MPKISIIIPCYNSFNIMNNCLKSLEKQTYKDFEVIIIDDCSTDNSYEELLKYKFKTKLDIKIFRNYVNSGPGPTRNNGIEKVVGNYLTFLDSDDYLEKDCLELINEVIKKYHVDCIIYDYYLDLKNKKIRKKSFFSNNKGLITKTDALIYSSGSTCCKVYRSEIIRNNYIRFPNLIRNEDMPFNKIAIANCNNFYYLNLPLYDYVMHQNSLMHNKSYDTENNAISAFGIVRNAIGEKYPNEVEAIFLQEMLYATVITMCKIRKKNKEIKSHINNLEKMYPNWSKNPIINTLSIHKKICLKLIKYKLIFFIKVIAYIAIQIKKKQV